MINKVAKLKKEIEKEQQKQAQIKMEAFNKEFIELQNRHGIKIVARLSTRTEGIIPVVVGVEVKEEEKSPVIAPK